MCTFIYIEQARKKEIEKSASQTKLYISQANKLNETGKHSAIQKEVTHTHTYIHTSEVLCAISMCEFMVPRLAEKSAPSVKPSKTVSISTH